MKISGKMLKKNLLIFFFTAISIINVFGSDYYWVGGSGDWSDINHWVTSSGGTTNHIQTPTANDNVIFDANSFSSSSAIVNLNSNTIFCKNFDAELINQNLTFSGVCNLMKVYGGVKLSKKLIISNFKFYFEAQSGSYDLSFKNLPLSNNLFFKGNASWTLLDSLHCGNISLESGTFNTNSHYVKAIDFISNTGNTRQLNISNSTLRLHSWDVSGAGYSVSAANSVIYLNGGKFRHLSTGNLVYNDLYLLGFCSISNMQLSITFRKVQFFQFGSIIGSNTYDSLIFTKGRNYTIAANTTQTINQDLVAVGDCKRPIRIESSSSFASFSKSTGSVVCSYLTLHHIHAVGGANFQAMATEDLGDNIGWNLLPPPSRTLYWVGSTGTWNDTIHWSYSSGGMGGECIPTIVDDVIVDTNSYLNSANVQIVIPAFCHDFTWTLNAIGNFQIVQKMKISGSLFFGSNLSLAIGSNIDFVSDANGETITTSNIDLKKAKIHFDGLGSWTLQDSINNKGGDFLLLKGHLLTNGQYIRTNFFGAINKKFKKLSLSSSVIDVEKTARFQQDSLYIYPGTSHIRMIGSKTLFESMGNFPDSLYNLSFVADSGSAISNINKSTFNKVSHYCDALMEGYSIEDTLYFKSGKSFVFTGRTDSINKALIANGSCSKVITMRENTAMGNFRFVMPSSAVVSVSHVSLRGAKAFGGANFLAINSSNLFNNTGWSFVNTAANHYWVGGAGNWQDSTHWSYSSGGQGGACIPKIYDNVYFDGNSFVSPNDSVIVDSNNIFCRDMSWIGASGNPSFYFDFSNYVHFISGSLTLIPAMTFVNKNETFFVWDQQNKTIDMKSQFFNNDIIFADSGKWTLLDTLVVKNKIYHYIGDLITNQKPVYAGSYFGMVDNPKLLDIQNNTFTLTQGNSSHFFTWVKSNQTSILTSNSEIIFEKGGMLKTRGNGQVVFNNVSFTDFDALGVVSHGYSVTNKFNKLLFKGDGQIQGTNYMDTLIFTKDNSYILEGGVHQYITNDWQANADCYGFIFVKGDFIGSSSVSNTAMVNMANGNVNLSGVKLKNVTGIGNGTFNIVNGLDMGGNSPNWQISSYPARTLYWVNSSGSWWDTAHWSLNSGGISGECVPTYIDDVYFTTPSFANNYDTAYSVSPIECHNMYWNYTPNYPLMDIRYLNIYGSLWLGDTMSINSDTQLKLYAMDTGNIIRSSNKVFSNTYFNGVGSWSLVDDFSSLNIYHNYGSFIAAGNIINTEKYNALSSMSIPPFRKLDIAGSDLDILYEMNINTDSFVLVANNSDIVFDNSLSTSPNFKLNLEGNHLLHFGRVSFMPSMIGLSTIKNSSSSIHSFEKVTINNSANIYGEHYFDSLVFHAGNTYKLEYGKTQNIGSYWFVRGNNCFALNLQSTKKGMTAYVNKLLGNVNGDFINMRDIHAIGGASFFAGGFSTDISNNSGWTFSNGPQYVYGLGPNVSLNLGSSVTLSSANFNGGPNTTYIWSTGSTSPNITVNQTGWYYITVNYAGGCIVYDSIWVGCNLNMNYSITNNPCFGDSLGIIVPIAPDTNYNYSYQWSNNTSSNVASGLVAGVYTVTVSADSGFCMLYDTLQITQPPQFFCSQDDTGFCKGDSVQLNLGNFIDFYWNDGYTGQYRWVNQRDSFYVKVMDTHGCWSFLDTVIVRQDIPPLIVLPDDTTICMGGSVVLDAGGDFDAYLWSNNSTMSSITVTNTGLYWVIVSERTCNSMDSVEIFNCPPKFIVPNVFTPNGDGINDFFEIEYQNIWKFEIRIYNRWGARVYHSTNIDSPWDGKIKGQDAIEGVYFWEIIYQEYNGKGGGLIDKKVNGTLTLFRH